MKEEKVAVIMKGEQLNALVQYLAGRPFAEVNEFFKMLSTLRGLSQEELDSLNEESPE